MVDNHIEENSPATPQLVSYTEWIFMAIGYRASRCFLRGSFRVGFRSSGCSSWTTEKNLGPGGRYLSSAWASVNPLLDPKGPTAVEHNHWIGFDVDVVLDLDDDDPQSSPLLTSVVTKFNLPSLATTAKRHHLTSCPTVGISELVGWSVGQLVVPHFKWQERKHFFFQSRPHFPGHL